MFMVADLFEHMRMAWWYLRCAVQRSAAVRVSEVGIRACVTEEAMRLLSHHANNQVYARIHTNMCAPFSKNISTA